MHSSTSSSEASGPFTRAARLNWPRITIWTIAVAVASLAVADAVLRRFGFEPTVQDSATLWAQQRARLEGPARTDDAVVFIGRSRIMQAIDREALTARFPSRTFVQLAEAGLDRHPLAVLRDVADSTDYTGVLVVSVTEDSFESRNLEGQADLVDYYHNKFRLNESINEHISVLAQENFAFLRPEVSIRNLVTSVFRRGGAPTPGVEMDRYRFRNTDFRDTEFSRERLRIARQRLESQIAEVVSGAIERPDPQVWLRDALEADRWVERIQNRGGRVVYVRMPTSGEMWKLGDLLYPREGFWDPFASRTAATTVHFADHPSLSNFDLPDLSHIRGDDRNRFTNALVDVLVQKRVM